jgi:hypothetical protein
MKYAGLLLLCGTVFAFVVPDHRVELAWNGPETVKVALALIGCWLLLYGVILRTQREVNRRWTSQ